MGACLFVPHCWFINGIFQLNKRPHSNSVFLWQVGWRANLRARGAASPWTCFPLQHQRSLLVLPFLMQIAGAPSKELKFSVVPRKPGASAHSSYFKCVLTGSSHALLLCCWFCVCWDWSGTWPHLTLRWLWARQRPFLPMPCSLGPCVTAGFPLRRGSCCRLAFLCAGTSPAAKGEHRATCCTLGVERGTTLCLKNGQHVLSPLAAISVRKETASRGWFCQYFLKQFVSELGAGLEQQVCSRAVFCGCSCNSPFFMWVGLQRVIFPAMIIRRYFFPDMFQWWCKAVNTWWGEAEQPKEWTKGVICASWIS